MDRKSLEEYIAKEREKCKKLEEKIFDKSQKKGISVLDFFPEYKSEHTPSYSSYTHDETIPVQLPFSRCLYWDFRPYKTEKMFKEQYGLQVEVCIELINKKLLKPILSSNWYRYINLDYLDPILEKNPPTYYRFTSYFNVLSGRTYYKLYEEAEKIFRGKLDEIKEVKEWDMKYPLGKEAYETKVCFDFARLLILYPEIFNKYVYPLIKTDRIIDASKLIILFDEILVDAYTCALEGHHKVPADKIELLEKFIINCDNLNKVINPEK